MECGVATVRTSYSDWTSESQIGAGSVRSMHASNPLTNGNTIVLPEPLNPPCCIGILEYSCRSGRMGKTSVEPCSGAPLNSAWVYLSCRLNCVYSGSSYKPRVNGAGKDVGPWGSYEAISSGCYGRTRHRAFSLRLEARNNTKHMIDRLSRRRPIE